MMIYVHTIDQERHRCQILNGVRQSCHVGNGLTTIGIPIATMCDRAKGIIKSLLCKDNV